MNSSKKISPLLIGLLCVLVVALCLLAYQLHQESVAKQQLRALTTSIDIQSPTRSSNATTTSSSESNSHATAATVPISNPTPSPAPASPITVSQAQSPTQTQMMTFEVVTTPAEQELGLGGRASIPDDFAMLFVFPQDGDYGFWMKNMLVPIDMIWLSDNATVVGIDASVQPDTYPEAFYPPMPVKYVLETRAGFAAEHGWTVGTQVTLPPPYGA